jgi:hypothetical protein
MSICGGDVDTSGQAAAAAANERVGMRALDLSEEQRAISNDREAELMDLIRTNSESTGQLQDAQLDQVLEASDRRQNIFNPLEAGLVDQAETYDSADRINDEMGKADASVVQAYDKAIAGSARDQLRLGVNPNSAKALALRENGALAMAKAAGNASSGAAERAKGKGFAMRMDAAALGRNLSSNQTAAADSALRAGNSQVSNMQSGVQQGNANFNTTMGGFGTAMQGYSNAGKIYGDIANVQSQEDPLGGLGQIAGLGIKAYSGGMFK